MFENNLVNDIYETRYIASWLRAGGNLYYLEDVADFRHWLESLGLKKAEISNIVHLATVGKMELEQSAEKFIAEHP